MQLAATKLEMRLGPVVLRVSFALEESVEAETLTLVKRVPSGNGVADGNGIPL